MSTQLFRDQFLAKFGTLVLYTPTGKELISGIGSNVVVCRADGTRIGEFREHQDDVFSVAVMQDGLALSGDRDGTIRLWRIADCKQIAAGQPGGLVWAVAASRDASMFASCSGGAPIIWRLEKPSGLFARSSLRPLTTLDSPVFGPLAPRALAFSPSCNYLAVGETDGVEIWRTKDWTKITVLPAGWPTSIAFSDSGGLIAAADSNNVQVWSVTKDFEKAASLSGHRDTVNCVAFSPTNRHLVSCGDDGQIIIWRTRDGERVEVHDAGKHGLRYFSVAVSSELNEIAVRRDRADVIIMRTGDILRH